MSRIELKHPERQAYTGGYADGVVLGDWLYVSGQGPLDLATGKVVSGTIEEETLRTLENIEAVLAQYGCTKADVAKCGCFLADMATFEAFDRSFTQFFAGIRPARTTVQAGLGLGIKVEIDAVAYIPQNSGAK
jgi:2-iminobutanoate/2-iminopropanoate deaminase